MKSFQFFFKRNLFILPLFILSLVCYSHEHIIEEEDTGVGVSRTPTYKLTEIDKLLTDLKKAGFIKSSVDSFGGGTVLHRYYPTEESEPVNAVFQKECSSQYNTFSNNRRLLINFRNNSDTANQDPGTGNTKRMVKGIETAFKECIYQIYKQYTNLNDFADTVFKYAGSVHHQLDCSNKTIALFNKNYAQSIASFRGDDRTTHFNEIKKQSESYITFQDNCIIHQTGIHGLQITVDPVKICSRDHSPQPISDWIMKLKSYFEKKVNGKSCHTLRDGFHTFIKSPVFQQFKTLPEKCGSIEKLKTVSSDCTALLEKLDPPYSKENEENLFNKCNTAKELAYKECFGDGNNQTELQKILDQINHKSLEVCEQNRLAKAQQAKQNCNTAVNKCIDSCHETIKGFKKDFLQCFFLPEFSEKAYEVLHGNNQHCMKRIKEIKQTFTKQAKQSPFEVKGINFNTLSQSNNSGGSIGRHIIKACEDPLEKTQIDKKNIRTESGLPKPEPAKQSTKHAP